MKLIDKDSVVVEIERRKKELIELNNDFINQWACGSLDNILSFINTLEVKDIDVNKISESLAEAEEYLDYTHTSNLAHNKPMIIARLRSVIKELNNAKLFQLTHDVKYRMERLDLQTLKGKLYGIN